MKNLYLKPHKESQKYLKYTRAKALLLDLAADKLSEVKIPSNLSDLLCLTIGILGEYSFAYNNQSQEKIVQEDLYFCAKYFDSYMRTQHVNQSQFLKLLAATTYRLVNMPGTSFLLVKDLEIKCIDSECSGLDLLIICLLQGLFPIDISLETKFGDDIKGVIYNFKIYFKTGNNTEFINSFLNNLTEKVYSQGNDIEIFLINLIRCISKIVLDTSLWRILPEASNLPLSNWQDFIQNHKQIQNLWPAQLLIAEKKVLQGESAIIQMPTSSGKTTSLTLIIKSAFLSNRTKLAIVIAPLKALCYEIYTNLEIDFETDLTTKVSLGNDVFQVDVNLDSEEDQNSILIFTPEKFEFLLRQDSQFAQKIGLIIFDEGHLLDSQQRGLAFELTLASLKQTLNPNTQIVFISAVISNAKELAYWLLQNDTKTIDSGNLIPKNQNIAFVDWKILETNNGVLRFVDEINIEDEAFFVPKFLQQINLGRKGRERKDRFFPEIIEKQQARIRYRQYDTNHISLYLMFLLSGKGLTVIFNSQKKSIPSVLNEAINNYQRNLTLPKPIESSNLDECNKLANLLKSNFGSNNIYFEASLLGIFAHHGDIPEGIKKAIEYAANKSYISSIVCTSTLAEGINLPIKFLIINSYKREKDLIKIRDFKNLIGRAGRSGKNTEGTIIFSNPRIYFEKDRRLRNWFKVKNLFQGECEACHSTLLSYFTSEPDEEEELQEWKINRKNTERTISQFILKTLSYTDDIQIVKNLAENTLAYNQADDSIKVQIVDLFVSTAQNILKNEPEQQKRSIFSKSILDLDSCKKIYIHVEENIIPVIQQFKTPEDFLNNIWSPIYLYIQFKYYKGIIGRFNEDTLLEICKEWIKGTSFYQIHELMQRIGRKKKGEQAITIDETVQVCQNIFGFDISLIIGSIIQILKSKNLKNPDSIQLLSLLQRQLKYGLNETNQIYLYERGLFDREIVKEITTQIPTQQIHTIYDLKQLILRQQIGIQSVILDKYPTFFSNQFKKQIENWSKQLDS